MGIYSFNGNKILTTSGGGMLVSDNEDWIKKAEFYATQARENALFYEHMEYGYNYRMSNVLAAIGVAQMEVLQERVVRKREIFETYKQMLQGIDEITFMPEVNSSKGNRWLTTITLEKSNPYQIIDALTRENIESRPLWKPMHLQPVFKNALVFANSFSEELFQKGLCLPSGTQMENADIQRICKVIQDTVLV